MEKELSVCLVQTSLFWEDKNKNLEHLGGLLAGISRPVNLIVLPESFTSGFSMKKEVAEQDTSVIQWMQEQAAKHQAAVAGSFFVQENGECYNRLHFVEPSGKVTTYDKKHLFRLTNEQSVFTPGNTQVVVHYKGWNLGLMVCYDLRFPVWMRRSDTYEYDAFVLVANWPERRSRAWKTLLQARAIENQSYGIGVNRVGTDGTGMLHSGDSAVIDPLGSPVAGAHPFKQELVYATLQASHLQAVRKNLPFYDDRDSFEILT